jgi:hypothetical protein
MAVFSDRCCPRVRRPRSGACARTASVAASGLGGRALQATISPRQQALPASREGCRRETGRGLGGICLPGLGGGQSLYALRMGCVTLFSATRLRPGLGSLA